MEQIPRTPASRTLQGLLDNLAQDPYKKVLPGPEFLAVEAWYNDQFDDLRIVTTCESADQFEEWIQGVGKSFVREDPSKERFELWGYSIITMNIEEEFLRGIEERDTWRQSHGDNARGHIEVSIQPGGVFGSWVPGCEEPLTGDAEPSDP